MDVFIAPHFSNTHRNNVRKSQDIKCVNMDQLLSGSCVETAGKLDLLTPPSSEERDVPSFNVKGETPLSHWKSQRETVHLPRIFNKKCHISMLCDEIQSRKLSSILEETTEEGGNRSQFTVGWKDELFSSSAFSCSTAITPTESPPKSVKRSNSCFLSSDCFKSSEMPIDCSKYKSNVTKSAQSECSPRKRIKILAPPISDAEYKENSSIKEMNSTNSCSAEWRLIKKTLYQHNFVLKQPPPARFPIRSAENNIKDATSVDFLSRLADRNMYHVVQKVMDYLDPLDIASLENVSRNWARVTAEVASRKELSRARKLALTSKENIPLRPKFVRCAAKSLNETTPKKLKIVTERNILPSQPVLTTPDISPRTKRFRAFIEEGKALSPTKKLERCPECRFPARIVGALATCSACKFKFCIQCRCRPHPLTPCSFVLALTSSPSPRKAPPRYSVGSLASKKALRRLL